jgi:hypothetical protein
MTGRAAGFCAGYPAPGYMNPAGGRGYGGWRGGGGRGRRNWYYATGLPGWARAQYGYPAWGGAVASPYGVTPPSASSEQELAGLRQQAEFLQNSLEQVNKRVQQLEADGKE